MWVFLKITQNPQENIGAGVWLQSYFQSETFIKKETPAQVFPCEFCEIFKKTFLIKQLRVTASVTSTMLKYDF